MHSILTNTSIGIIFFWCCLSNAISENINFDWNVLNAGEVIIEEIENDQGTPGVRAVFIVEASREDIWTALTDYVNFKKFFHDIDEMKVISTDSNGAQVEFWADVVLMKLHYVLQRNYVKPGYHLTWNQVSGDLRDIQGSWQIRETQSSEKKLLIYESYADLGSVVITWIIRQGAKQKAKKMAYNLRNWIESKTIPNTRE
ncbi:MAG: hypothetical protein A4S08_06050 [Proteobacteria bacterium SG_bin4]|nr:MAG: hypothetical protein A4S08_06050 [Proteobacteria bacterium SG_bin4]